MKHLFMALAFLIVTTNVHGAGTAQKELWKYPYWIRSECLELTSYRDRKASYNDYPAALQCARNTVEYLEEQRLRESKIELNETKIELLRRNYSNWNYPWKEKGER